MTKEQMEDKIKEIEKEISDYERLYRIYEHTLEVVSINMHETKRELKRLENLKYYYELKMKLG